MTKSYKAANLKAQEQLFRILFENAAVGIAQISQQGHFITINNKMAEITGYTKEELLQKTFQEITHPDDLESDIKQAEAMYRGEIGSYSMEKRYIRKDGSSVWVELTGSAVFNDTGDFEMYVAIIEDISEKKQTEEALYKSLQLYKVASSAAKIGAYFRNLQTGENQWSPEFLALYGLKPDEALPMNDMIPKAVHPDDRESVLKVAQRHYDQSNNTEFSSDHRIILPDGTIRWLNVRGITERDLKKNPVNTYGIAMDITERKNIEKQLINDSKLFEDLVYIAAHDLKGPVSNMDTALDLMDSLPMESKVMLLKKFRDIAGQLNITIQGVTNILHMRNVDKSAASPINVEMLLDKILMEFNSNLDQVSIKTNFFKKPTITYVEIFLYSIIKNLISNSIKYCRENVPLNIEITIELQDDFTLFSISDNGIGIDTEKYGEQLFTPFRRFSTKETKGTGIGLYIVKNIIEQNGGFLKVESTPGKGTTFYCYLKEYL